MKISALSKTSSRISRAGAQRLGGAGSIADAMAGKAQESKLARYAQRNERPCASCAKGKHQCNSIHCPCERCNPEVKL